MIVHIETRVQAIFGVLDGDEVQAQPPVTLVINKCTREAFLEAFETITQQRNAMEPPPALSQNGASPAART